MSVAAHLSALLLTASALVPQHTSVANDVGPDIVVTGHRLPSGRVIDQAIRTVARPTPSGGGAAQYARWVVPICPVVDGTSDAQAREIEADIRDIAARVGAPVAPASCKANLGVFFADDPGDFIRQMDRRHPGMLEGARKQDRILFQDRNMPVRWISITRVADPDGVAPDPVGGSGVDGGTNRVFDASRIQAPTQTSFARVIMVVDRKVTAESPPSSLADYISMLALARLNPGAEPTGVQTILSLLPASAKKKVPEKLTQFDEVYLKALYAVNLAMPANAQQVQMVKAIRKFSGSNNVSLN